MSSSGRGRSLTRQSCSAQLLQECEHVRSEIERATGYKEVQTYGSNLEESLRGTAGGDILLENGVELLRQHLSCGSGRCSAVGETKIRLRHSRAEKEIT